MYRLYLLGAFAAVLIPAVFASFIYDLTKVRIFIIMILVGLIGGGFTFYKSDRFAVIRWEYVSPPAPAAEGDFIKLSEHFSAHDSDLTAVCADVLDPRDWTGVLEQVIPGTGTIPYMRVQIAPFIWFHSPIGVRSPAGFGRQAIQALEVGDRVRFSASYLRDANGCPEVSLDPETRDIDFQVEFVSMGRVEGT